MNVWDYLLKDFSPRLCNKMIELPEVFGLINSGDDGPVWVKEEVWSVFSLKKCLLK